MVRYFVVIVGLGAGALIEEQTFDKMVTASYRADRMGVYNCVETMQVMTGDDEACIAQATRRYKIPFRIDRWDA